MPRKGLWSLSSRTGRCSEGKGGKRRCGTGGRDTGGTQAVQARPARQAGPTVACRAMPACSHRRAPHLPPRALPPAGDIRSVQSAPSACHLSLQQAITPCPGHSPLPSVLPCLLPTQDVCPTSTKHMPVISREQAVMVERWLGAHSALGQARGTVLKWLLDAGDTQVRGCRGGGHSALGRPEGRC